jgi:exopolysaccharide biosynthesis polyprenyl glycosylphosphotransferase
MLAAKLTQRLGDRFNLVGFIDDDPPPIWDELQSVPTLGGVRALRAVISTHDVQRVIVAFSYQSHDRTRRLLAALKDLNVQIDVVPRLFDLLGPNAVVHSIEGMPLVGRPPAQRSPTAHAAKRALDLVVACLAVVVLAPLFLALTILTRLDSPGPVIYRGERVGRGGRRFMQLKFRTMKSEFCRGPQYGGAEADAAFESLLRSNPALEAQFRRTHKLDPDPRVTRWGRLLRSTSLDELPQLFNVIRGDLSLVGPRPVTAEELVRYGDDADQLLSVRPGLTGYWQINGRSALSYDERVRLDMAYVCGWSLVLDLKIIAKTSRTVTARAGVA